MAGKSRGGTAAEAAGIEFLLAGLAREVKPASASDQTIRDRIVAELAGQSWTPAALIDVIVRDGSWTSLRSDHRRARARGDHRGRRKCARCEARDDHLAWVDAMSGMVFSPSDEEVARAKASWAARTTVGTDGKSGGEWLQRGMNRPKVLPTT